MRTLTGILLAIALATLLPPASAQAPSFDEPYQVRAALGDIPTTPAIEPAGTWNVEQRLTVPFDNASAESARTFHFTLPAGSTLLNATCDCTRATHSESAGVSTFVILPQTPTGEHTIRVVTKQAATQVVGGTVQPPLEATGDAVVILYVPGGSDVASNVGFAKVGTAPSDPSKVIQYATFSGDHPMPRDLWYAIHPGTTVTTATDDGGFSIMDWLLPLAIGLLVGMVVWAMLVARGVVQAKSRKQVATTAAHVEAAANDSPAVLEGKKRALFAALKEVELAKQANEMPLEVYDVVKADLKKQTVTVMRALETGSGESRP